MRTATLKLTSILSVVALTACGDARANEASADELKRDLELATATTMKLATPAVDSALLSALETKPMRAPEQSTVVRRGAGSRAVQSRTPTVAAEMDTEAAAVDETEVTETVAEAAAPESREPVAVAPRPAPAGDYGSGIMGGGVGPAGTGTGVVLRGGGVDGDNCDLHRRGRRGGTVVGPIFIPQQTARPTGTIGGVTVAGGSMGARSPRTETRTTGAAAPSSRPAIGGRGGRIGLR